MEEKAYPEWVHEVVVPYNLTGVGSDAFNAHQAMGQNITLLCYIDIFELKG